jgi:hypothetical protein
MFQKSPALTAFWTFIESSRYITGLVIEMDGFPVGLFILFVTIFQAEYFRSKTKFSNQIFSVEHRLFKSFIFGQKPSFQTEYFWRRRDFSNRIFLATQGLFILSTLPFQ